MHFIDKDLLTHRVHNWCVKDNGPTAVVVVTTDARGNSTVYHYGVPSTQTREIISEATWFRLGSVTKSVVAFAVLYYANRAELDIDSEILQDLLNETSEDKNPTLTLRSLLSHTSGLPNGVALSTRAIGGPRTWVKQIKPVKRRFSYSNLGYALLGMWMRKVTGLAEDQWLQKFALDPLGLSEIAFVPPIGAQRAIGHCFDPIRNQRVSVDLKCPDRRLAPAGYLWSTSRGLEGLVRSFTHPPSPLAKKVLNEMCSPESESFGPQELRYGLGLFTRYVNDKLIAFHEGEISGFKTLLEFCPECATGTGIVANTSGLGNEPRDMIRDSKRSSFAHLYESDQIQELPRQISTSSTFVGHSFGILKIRRYKNRYLGSVNAHSFTLTPIGPRTFTGICGSRNILLKMKVNETDKCPYIYVNGNLGTSFRLRKRKNSTLDTKWLGRYQNGFWIEIYLNPYGLIYVASNYTGTNDPAVSLSGRCLATDFGIMVFSTKKGRRRLRLLGVNYFEEC